MAVVMHVVICFSTKFLNDLDVCMHISIIYYLPVRLTICGDLSSCVFLVLSVDYIRLVYVDDGTACNFPRPCGARAYVLITLDLRASAPWAGQ